VLRRLAGSDGYATVVVSRRDPDLVLRRFAGSVVIAVTIAGAGVVVVAAARSCRSAARGGP
jgi:hypothetical protein